MWNMLIHYGNTSGFSRICSIGVSYLYIINVIFLSYAVMIPFLMFSIFFAVKALREWKIGMLSLYLVSFDEITTFAVIYSFFASNNHYFYGVLQILFLISSNWFSGSSNNLFGEEYKNLTKCDKFMA